MITEALATFGSESSRCPPGALIAAQVGEERPRLVEVLDDVAADDPVEALVDEADDLADVAAEDVVDPLAGDGGGALIELDADDAALLPLLQRCAEGRFAAAEFEDRLRVGDDAREEIEPGLSAHRAPAMDVVVRARSPLPVPTTRGAALRPLLPGTRWGRDRSPDRTCPTSPSRCRRLRFCMSAVTSCSSRRVRYGDERRRRCFSWCRLIRHRQRRRRAGRIEHLGQPRGEIRRRDARADR